MLADKVLALMCVLARYNNTKDFLCSGLSRLLTSRDLTPFYILLLYFSSTIKKRGILDMFLAAHEQLGFSSSRK